jgi:hypothetical protein
MQILVVILNDKRIKIYLVILLYVAAFVSEVNSQSNIYIASAEWCVCCRVLKERLTERKIAFNEFKYTVNPKDTLHYRLSKFIKYLPATFIDVNNNHYLDEDEPYITGSVTGEGLIDIYLGTHKTITREDYQLFTSTGKDVLKKVNKIKISGKLHGDGNNGESIKLGDINYEISVDIRQNFLKLFYVPADTMNRFTCTFQIEKEKDRIGYSILREFPAKDSLDTDVPQEVMEHVNDYLLKLNKQL